jgi:glycine oxidase
MRVVIIGAGVAGLSIGWRLLQAGSEVVVLERAQPGQGATWASAGMIAVTGENGDSAAPEAKFAQYSGSLWPSFAADVEAASGRSIAFRADGALTVASDETVAGLLAARAAASDGKVRFLSPPEARELEPLLAPDIAGALFDPTEAQVDNRALGAALAAAFVRAGGMLQSNETVVRLEVFGGRVIGAVTPFARYHGDAFILAAGAWTSRIDGLPPDAMPPVVPVKGEMIALAPSKADTLPKRIVWGNEVYLVPRHDRLFVGATVSREGFDTSVTDAAADWLKSHAAGVMPALAEWELAEHWAGLRPGSPDNLPILGETGIRGLFIASGQFRNGILFAPAIAEALCSLVLGRSPPSLVAAFNPARFRVQALLAKAGPTG